MDNIKSFITLNKLLKKGNGKPILLGEDNYKFSYKKTYNLDEVNNWEEKHKIELPDEYKNFMTNNWCL